MRDLKFIAGIAAPFVLLSLYPSITEAETECQPRQHYVCIGNYCFCSERDQLPAPQMLAKYIQSKEGVDKSQIVNLDEVLQKVVKESAQKLDIPIKFKVKIQGKENTPPKEVEYQIKTSK